jgi:hypothetical protein
MAIKAAEYTVAFNTEAAKAAWTSLETALKDGSGDVAAAAAAMRTAFDQVNNSHRTGKKDVDAFTKLIKDEKMETRNLGFLMRNSAESVGTLSNALGGPSGLGQMIGSTYSRFDQITFAFEALEAAGTKAGGSFAKVAGILGGIAIPAGVAITAFAAIKSEVDQDEEQIKKLDERIRDLSIELRMIPVDRLTELNRRLDEVGKKEPEMQFWTAIKFGVDSVLKTSLFQKDVERQTKEIQVERLELTKQQRAEMERQQQIVLQNVRTYDALIEAQFRNTELQAKLTTSEEESLGFMRQQYALRQSYISSLEEQFWRLRDSGASTKDLLDYDTRITSEKIKQRELQRAIAEEQRRANSRRGDVGMLSIIDIWKEEYTFIENAQKRLIMEARNAPSKLQGVAAIDPLSTDEVLANFTSLQESVLSIGDTLAGNLASGFMKGFQSGKFMLSDFLSAMAQSLLQFAAQEAAFGMISGLLSLIPGVGTFASIASKMGSRLFKPSSAGAGVVGVDTGNSSSRGVPGVTSSATASISDLGVGIQQMIQEQRATQFVIRNNRPVLYAGGVLSPDDIFTETLPKAERRRARRIK